MEARDRGRPDRSRREAEGGGGSDRAAELRGGISGDAGGRLGGQRCVHAEGGGGEERREGGEYMPAAALLESLACAV